MYQVKFKIDGETQYGIVDRYANEAKLLRDDQVLVEDSITPDIWILGIDEVEEVSLDVRPNEYAKYVSMKHKEAVDRSSQFNTLAPGKLFSIPVDDGHSYYVVTDINSEGVHIEWRGFSPERFIAPGFGYGGVFEKKRILDLVRSEDKLRYLTRETA